MQHVQAAAADENDHPADGAEPSYNQQLGKAINYDHRRTSVLPDMETAAALGRGQPRKVEYKGYDPNL